jgi:pimeloyl-ACP methyl ester carboxylesterase
MQVRAPGGDGRWHNVVLDPEAVTAVAYNATYLSPTYREFTAAVRAALAGDARPLGRLFAEFWWTGDTSSNPRAYSSGAEAAVSCHDYPQLFDLWRSEDARKEEYRDAFARKERTNPGLYAPFTITEYKRSGWTSFGMCLEWPKPPKGASFGPPKPIDGRYPAVPTLVLSGELDTITTAAEGDMVAERFPLSRHIVVANGLHVVGGARPDSCGPRLVRHVIRTGGLDIPASLEQCAAAAPIIRAVGTYPRELARVQLPSGVVDDTVARVTVTAANTAADLIDRWWQGYSDTGHGLRGGEWRYTGDTRVRFTLTGVKLVRDLPVSGSFTWERTTGNVSVDLRVPGVGGVRTVSGSWNADDSGAVATLRVTGALGPTTLVFPAP